MGTIRKYLALGVSLGLLGCGGELATPVAEVKSQDSGAHAPASIRFKKDPNVIVVDSEKDKIVQFLEKSSRYLTPAYIAEKFVADLEAHGLVSAKDLIPYLGISYSCTKSSLYAISALGNIDAQTLDALKTFARSTKNWNTEARVISLILANGSRNNSLDFLGSVVSKLGISSIWRVMGWIPKQYESLLAGNEAVDLFLEKLCLRVHELFEKFPPGSVEPWLLTGYMSRPPLNRKKYRTILIGALFTSLRNIGIASQYSAVAALGYINKNKDVEPQLISEGALKLGEVYDANAAKLFLWYVYRNLRISETNFTRPIIEAIGKQHTSLRKYIERLQAPASPSDKDGLRKEFEEAYLATHPSGYSVPAPLVRRYSAQRPPK